MFNIETIFLPYYLKEYALRELTKLYSFTELKIVHNNSDNNQKQTINTHFLPQILETKDTRQKFGEIKNKQIPQKPRRNRKLEEKILPQEIKETSQNRQSSRLRNQRRKDYKTFFPQSKILKEVEFQKPL